MSHFSEDSVIGLDLKSVVKSLPMKQADENQQAIWLNDNKGNNIPRLVIGAENDFVVDKQGVEETAKFLNGKNKNDNCCNAIQ